MNRIVIHTDSMKCLGAFSASVMTVGIFLLPAAFDINANEPTDDPLVVNTSFETIGKDGMPEGWCVRNKNKNGTITLDETMAAHGGFSVRLSSAAPMEGGMFFGQIISPESINRIKPGTPMKLSIKVNTGGDPGVKFMFYLERLKDGKYLKGAKSGVETDYFGWMDKSIVFDYPDDGPVSDARIWVSLMTPGNLNVDCFELAPASEEDIRAAKSAEAVKAAYSRSVTHRRDLGASVRRGHNDGLRRAWPCLREFHREGLCTRDDGEQAGSVPRCPGGHDCETVSLQRGKMGVYSRKSWRTKWRRRNPDAWRISLLL